MRVVQVDSSRVWRGGQQQLLLLTGELRSLGVAPLIVARPGQVTTRLQAQGFDVLPWGRQAWRAMRTADIVHAHDGRAHSWMLAATTGGRAHRILSRRVAYPIASPLSRWKYRRMDAVIAVSAHVRDQVLTTGIAPQRVLIVPDAINLAALPAPAPARARVRALMKTPGDAPVVVCLSAFSPEKGVADLLAAVALWPSPRPQVWLVGDGAERAHLQSFVNDNRLSSTVQFVSATPPCNGEPLTPADWVAAADVMVMPSRVEGLGSAALLAMALECPVLATAAGGIPDLVTNGVTGMLVAVSDPAALAAGCLRLLREREWTAALVCQARALVERRFTSAQMAASTWKLYQALGSGLPPW